MASLLDFLSPSVISSTVTCTGTCIALSHSGSAIPRHFAKAKSMLENPTIGYDSDAKHYNYLFARHGVPSGQKWPNVVNHAISRVEGELAGLKDGLTSLKSDLQHEMARSSGLDSKYASLMVKIDDVERLASDGAASRVADGLRELSDGLDRVELQVGSQDSRCDGLGSDIASLTKEIRDIALLASKYSEVTQLAEDMAVVKDAVSSAKDELSASLDKQVADFRAELRVISSIKEESSKAISNLGEDFRQQIIAAEEDILSARNDMSELVHQFAQIFEDDIALASKKLHEHVAAAVNGAQDETQENLQKIRQDLDDFYNNVEASLKTYRKDLSMARDDISESVIRVNNELREEIESTNKDLYDTQAELKKLQQELDNANNTIDESHNSIREGLFAARNELAGSLEKCVKELREEIKTTKMAISSAQDEKSEYLDDCITDLQAGNRTARKELIETEMKLESLQKQVNEARDGAKNIQNTSEACAQDVSTLKTEFDTMKGGLNQARTSIEESNEQLHTALSVTRQELQESAAKYNADLKKEVDATRKELADAKSMLQGLQKHVEAAKTEVKTSHETTKGHTRNISLLKTEVGHIEKALKNSKDSLAASKKATEDALTNAQQAAADAAARTNESLRQESEATKKALANAQLELKSLRDALDALSAARQETADSVTLSSEALRKENEATKKALTEAQAELYSLRAELETAKADHREISEATGSYARDLSATNAELKRLREELAREREDKQNTPALSPEDLDSHAEELSTLRTELDKLKQELQSEREAKQNSTVVSPEEFYALAKDFSDMAARISQVEPLHEEVHFLRRRLRDWDLGSVADSELASTYSYETGYGDVPGTPQTGEHRRSLSIKSGRSTDNPVRTPAKRAASSDLRSALLPNQELTKDGKIKKRPTRRDPKRSSSHAV
ncbi:hypothetical protein TruAng_003226 [Truncatella angustata]|nr:hypothetical protein TruAng_003226 [Truncatella angustata]